MIKRYRHSTSLLLRAGPKEQAFTRMTLLMPAVSITIIFNVAVSSQEKLVHKLIC